MPDKKKDDESQPAENESPKLYTQEQFNEALKAGEEAVRAELEDQVSELSRQLEALKKTNPLKSGDIDVTKIVTDAVAAARKEWDKTHKKEMSELQNRVNALSEENTSRKVQAWKASLIEEYNNQVIPDLIKGDTEEELRQSAETAHASWLEVMKSAGVEITNEEEEETEDEEEAPPTEEEQAALNNEHAEDFRRSGRVERPVAIKKSQPVSTKSQGRVVMPSLPAMGDRGGSRRNEPDANLRGVKGMSMAEYRANRGKIQQAVKARYSSGGG